MPRLFPSTTHGCDTDHPQSLASDNVFRDGATRETRTITGSVAAGCALASTIAIAD